MTFTSGSETIDMFFTTNGGALVHSFGPGHDSIIFAAPAHTAAVTQAEMAGTYSILVFDDSASSDKIFPAQLTIPTSGDWSGSRMTDVSTGTLSGGSKVFQNFTPVSSTGILSGLFTVTLDNGSDDGRLSCSYFVYNGTQTLACNGYGQDSAKKPFFLLGKKI
jgi:hypothetical protein